MRSNSHSPTGFSRATEWLGRLAAVMSAVLLVLVLVAVQKGLEVKQSTRSIVGNFRQANQDFDDRADLGAPARAHNQLVELRSVLAELNVTTGVAVEKLAMMLPDMQTLVVAGRDDVDFANRLEGIAASLQGAAGSLHAISTDANSAVVVVNERLEIALGLADQLNDELRRTTNKLAPIPAQGNLIPAPSGGN
ncbi:hypothetical protein [Hoyosella subflava]|uniref:Transmembrane protein n=1 Tax=Hoyosella subflava (strain DSM 45089 / JCM 17490 / NBRC 109087 / DQS3-9A1) TaxID=443218 RepID=F6EQE1_HOYSD|nr:hypothetical protein [Hoyosella subflava]AEF40626.1 hypothetical protein AS9A_2177 [Hoyosella subflava DQS3-9A1]